MHQRQWSWARLQANFQHQRKLFLLVFLWTCLCLLLFRSSSSRQLDSNREHLADRSARSPVTSASHNLPSFSPKLVQHEPSKPEEMKDEVILDIVNNINDCHYDYPNLLDLQFNNVHWQRMSSSFDQKSSNSTAPNATYYLYNAYYDDRWRGGLPSVRILAMIDRIQPPPTHCLLWQDRLRHPESGQMVPLITKATFVYAWYPKWGNYRDGLLQPWIVTCALPKQYSRLVPDSVSLVEAPRLLEEQNFIVDEEQSRRRRQAQSSLNQDQSQTNSIAMPAAYSSSSPSVDQSGGASFASSIKPPPSTSKSKYDCSQLGRITNNLPVFNRRPKVKGKFAVCVKGLDFPHEDVSVRLVEWLELLNLLGAGKVFLYSLNVHENISRVLHYYQQRGLVELSPLTLPGDQPNLPEYQHLFLKSKLTAKRQNELIPYNDCLYRNLHSYQYLALLDIDEIIMPLKQHTWHELMQQVESMSLAEQNYSRASYNVRNVYFFDDLSGPMGTTSSSSSPSQAPNADGSSQNENDEEEKIQELEHGIPHYLHMMQHVYRSKNYTKPGQYVKCFHNTERVVSLHNHFPMNCFGQCTTYSIPIQLAHLQHYRKDCVGPLKQSCKSDFRVFTQRDTTIWKYRQQMIRRTTRVLNRLGLLSPG